VARLPSAIEITFRPDGAWQALRAADPPWIESVLRHALPFSLVPALAWPLGQAWSGELPLMPAALTASLVSTVLLTLASILVLAAAFYLLCPFFDMPRAWPRSVAVAAFASTPVLLAGGLLVVPGMIVASVASLIHCFALCYLGVQRVLGCRESEAAFFVAAACMLALLGGLLLGGLCSAIGLI
jgi:Yip1 domain